MQRPNDPPVPEPAQPAALARRLAAILYDWLLLAGLIFSFALVTVVVRAGRSVEPGTWWFDLGLLVIPLVFFCGFWTHGGQTLGMRAWRIRVERADGRPVRWRDALVRCVAACIAVLPAGVGFWWSLVDARRRCWHDLWSGTRLVLQPTAVKRAPE